MHPLFYALFSAVCTSLLANGYKVAVVRKANRTAVIAVLQIVSALVIGVLACLTRNLAMNPTVFGLGVFGGLNMYVCMVAFVRVMRYGRLAVQWTVISLAVSVPVSER